MQVIKRDGTLCEFDREKIRIAIDKAIKASNEELTAYQKKKLKNFVSLLPNTLIIDGGDCISVECIQNSVEEWLMSNGFHQTAKSYILYREKHKNIRDWVNSKLDFIERYKRSNNNADATIDDNSNASNKNVGVLNNESHKEDNINISRGIISHKLKELYPDFDAKQYERDLADHIIYKHDESSFSNPVPYCVSVTMYPFLTDGIKKLGGLSASPKNLDSFCGIFVNMVHAISGQYAGAVATSEFLLYFTYFAKKEWGNDFYLHPDKVITQNTNRPMTIDKQIEQYFQQIVYTINQPIGARGLQSVFWNVSYFDREFFNGMFGNFVFPDMTTPDWESLSWIQKKFMTWFNNERLKTILTFPVESFALVYKDGKFADQESADFVAEEYARGHSFFTYISDTVDSLSSCCRLRNAVTTKEFNFTNGNMGVQTGSKSVITLNLSRIIQNFMATNTVGNQHLEINNEAHRQLFKVAWKHESTSDCVHKEFVEYMNSILERVFKYHVAYNELLWEMKDSHLLTVYDAGFIDLNKQYLTIGLNGLNQAAEFLGMKCTNNEDYKSFCKLVFSTITGFINTHNIVQFGHQITLNCEQVPAESLAIKNYNWDKSDGYWVPADTNLYASYIFKPNDSELSIFDKILLHSREFAAEELSGGQAAHLNLSEHLSVEQYKKVLQYAGKVGCNYFTFNVPNSECNHCGFITKVPIEECPHCCSKNISYYDRIIGYLTKINNWSSGRQIEQKTRVYQPKDCV